MHEKLQLTPLIDIAFLVLIFFMALPMRRLDGKLEAFLPENGINPTIETVRTPVRIRVREYGFQLGDTRTASAWDLAPTLRKLGPDHKYQIRATPGIDTQKVVELVDVLAGLRYRHVEFEGTKLPGRAIRRAVPLPRPRPQ